MTTYYMSGGNYPEEVHTFENFEQLKEHYKAAKDISFGGNSYVIPVNGQPIGIKLQDIKSEKDLLSLYQAAIEEMKIILHKSKLEMETL